MTNLSGANLNNGAAVGPQGEGMDSPSTFPTYPEYKDSGVEWLGAVPAHWAFTPIKHLALLNPRKSDFAGDTEQLCSFVPMEKLKTGVVQLDEERPIEEVIGGYTYFEDGDVLQAKVTPCFENKNVAIAKGLTNGIGFGSSEINVLRPYQGVNAEYLYYRVQEDSYMSFCTSSMIGAGGLKRVPTDVINNFKIAAPTLCEQTQIARFLDHETARIDALIEEQQRLIELLKEKRQAVISHAVTKGLDPTVKMKDSGVEWLGEVPAHWDVLPVWMLFQMGRGRVISHDEISENSGDYPVYSSQTERDGVMGSINTYDFEGDYLTWTTDGANAGTVFRRSGKFNCTNVCGTLLPKRKDDDLRYFVDAVGICTAAFIRHDINPKLMNNVMASIKVPAPPLMEQTAIAAYVSAFKDKETVLIQEAFTGISLLQERRSALISAAVTGKIDVRDWQPPASTQAPESAVAEAN